MTESCLCKIQAMRFLHNLSNFVNHDMSTLAYIFLHLACSIASNCNWHPNAGCVIYTMNLLLALHSSCTSLACHCQLQSIMHLPVRHSCTAACTLEPEATSPEREGMLPIGHHRGNSLGWCRTWRAAKHYCRAKRRLARKLSMKLLPTACS